MDNSLGFSTRVQSPIEQLVGSYVLVGDGNSGRYAARLSRVDLPGEMVIVEEALTLFFGDTKVQPRGPIQFSLATASIVPFTEDNYRATHDNLNYLIGLREEHVLVGDRNGGRVTDISGMMVTLNPSYRVMPVFGWQKGGQISVAYDKEQIVRVTKSYLTALVDDSTKEYARREAERNIANGEIRLRALRLEKALKGAEQGTKSHKKVTKRRKA